MQNTNEIFLSVDCGEFFQQNILSLYPSINTDGHISSIYIEGITVRKERMKKKIKKYDDVSVLQIELQTNLNPLVNLSIIFNLLPDERPSSLPPSFLHLHLFFFTTNSTPSNFIINQPPTTYSATLTLNLSVSLF